MLIKTVSEQSASFTFCSAFNRRSIHILSVFVSSTSSYDVVAKKFNDCWNFGKMPSFCLTKLQNLCIKSAILASHTLVEFVDHMDEFLLNIGLKRLFQKNAFISSEINYTYIERIDLKGFDISVAKIIWNEHILPSRHLWIMWIDSKYTEKWKR